MFLEFEITAAGQARASGPDRRSLALRQPTLPEMRECQAEGCRTAARYNLPGETVGAFCNEHRAEGMRNVMHKPCAAEGCFMQATVVRLRTFPLAS